MSEVHIDVHRVAELARLTCSETEEARFAKELDAVLEYVAVLDQVDTEGVEPTSHPIPLTTPFRDDEANVSLTRDAALANAPATDGESFVVPRVV